MILFIAAMLLVGTAAQATDQKINDQSDRVTKRYLDTQPITFIEGGVTYYIYPNGEIDFKNPVRRTRTYTNARIGYNNSAPGYSKNRVQYNRPLVKYDRYGKLKQVGYTTISYNRYNKVRRVGSVTMNYNRQGKLIQVGDLYIYYTKKGYIKDTKGSVHYIQNKRSNTNVYTNRKRNIR